MAKPSFIKTVPHSVPLKNKKSHKRLLASYLWDVRVPRVGLEPTRVSPLVFETNASTNSATWAFQKIGWQK